MIYCISAHPLFNISRWLTWYMDQSSQRPVDWPLHQPQLILTIGQSCTQLCSSRDRTHWVDGTQAKSSGGKTSRPAWYRPWCLVTVTQRPILTELKVPKGVVGPGRWGGGQTIQHPLTSARLLSKETLYGCYLRIMGSRWAMLVLWSSWGFRAEYKQRPCKLYWANIPVSSLVRHCSQFEAKAVCA